jgi:hypothetical protein
MVSCLFPLAPSSHAQDSPSWEVALYDIAGRAVVIVRPDAAETIPAPPCFQPTLEPGDYNNWLRRSVAISPDNRFLAVTLVHSYPGVLVADLKHGTCFEARLDLDAELATASYDLDVAVFSPDSSQMAFAYTTYGPLGKIALVDLIESPGTIQQILDWPGNPLLSDWRSDGITFFTTCYGCEPIVDGVLHRWDPQTDAVILTNEPFTRVYADFLPLTGETLHTTSDEEYPVPPALDARNLVEYVSGGERRVVYFAPDVSSLSRPTWVLDGNAFIVRQTLVYRDGRTLPLADTACASALAGTPDGWLEQTERTLYTCRVVEGTIVATPVDTQLSGLTLLLRQSPLGATAAGEMAQVPFADQFRLSWCGTGAQAPRLGFGTLAGHVIGAAPLSLYEEPETGAAVVGTFSTFTLVNGPFCADPDSVWWLLDAQGQLGWAPERNNGQRWLDLDCTSATPARYQIGESVELYGKTDYYTALHTMPLTGEVITRMKMVQPMTVLDGPVCDRDWYWWLLDYQGQIGWAIEPPPPAG